MSVHIGQSTIDAVVADGKPLMIDAQQLQDRGVDVVDLRGVVAIQRFVAPLIGFAVTSPPA